MNALDKIVSAAADPPVAAAAAQRRAALVVAGMHRSGTSALTRVLNLLGCDVARDIMPADEHNRRGYWETLAVSDLNDRILASAGLAWDSWEALDPAWYAGAAAAAFRADAIEAIEAQYGRSELFVLKDPRICRLLPFWVEVLESLGISANVILTVRRPTEVAASLRRRNGTNANGAQLAWLRHVLDAEAASRHLPRTCVSYDDLLGDWRGMIGRLGESLGVAWPREPDAAATEVDGFLTPDLRTASAERGLGEVVEFSPWVSEAWSVLSRWTEGGYRDADLARLDLIREAFDGSEPNFARLAAEYQRYARHMDVSYAALHRRAEADAATLAGYTDLAGRLTLEKAEADRRTTALEAALAEAHEARRAAELALAEAGKVIDLQHREHGELRRGLDTLRALVAAGLQAE